MSKQKILGPFKQIITMRGLALRGAIADEQLEVLENAALVIENSLITKILTQSEFNLLLKEAKTLSLNHKSKLIKYQGNESELIYFEKAMLALPGFVDSHTHICFAGSRAADYTRRLNGESYQKIAEQGGGILSTVYATRSASELELINLLSQRVQTHAARGVTTIEVKSGYGLTVEDELKMLRAIAQLNAQSNMPELIPTCLAAHVKGPEFDSPKEYLDHMLRKLLPQVREQNLAKRIDIFVEEGAFDLELAREYLEQSKKLGFAITVHADQFTTGGSQLAAELGAVSADHLELSADAELERLAQANVIATALPGASLGLGCQFAAARKILDKGLCLAIASDWNPGSAPMGDLLTQAAILAANQKLSTAETLAGITYRGAAALELYDRGIVDIGKRADIIAFEADDYREILYQQGSLKPSFVNIETLSLS